MDNVLLWIALSETEGIGPAYLKEIYDALISMNLSVKDLFDLTAVELKNEFSFNEKINQGILSAKNHIPQVEKDYFALLDAHIDVVPFFSVNYPQQLFDTLGHGFPPFLYTIGEQSILKQKGVAILGDKFVSQRGDSNAFLSAKELAKHHISVISGFASGADLTAHHSALENHGTTVAFVPYGMQHMKIPEYLKNVYSPEKMIIVSVFYPTAEPDTFKAFIRNKMACALSKAVYIIEAPEDGGIFEAAKSAHKLGIPLYTSEYAEYPENAGGNKKIIQDFNGIPVRGKMENNLLVPNIDKIIASVKFT